MIKKTCHSILSIMLMVSCTENKKQNNKNYEEYKGLKITEDISKNDIKYELIFPDTIKRGEAYDAVLYFESDFDTIVDPIQFAVKLDSTKPRVIQFYRYEPKKLSSHPLKTNLLICF